MEHLIYALTETFPGFYLWLVEHWPNIHQSIMNYYPEL